MGINGEKNLYNQYEKLLEKFDIQTLLLKEQNELIKELTKTIKEKDLKIEKLILENERLKTNNKKDSSNSSKPSGSNGLKKVITNRREKSDKKQGRQLNHELYKLDEDKINELIVFNKNPFTDKRKSAESLSCL